MPAPKEIIEAIKKVRGEVGSIKHDASNPHGEYTYVSIDRYYEKVGKAVTAAGLIWRTREVAFDIIDNVAKDKTRAHVKAKFAYDLYHGATEFLDYMTVTIISPVDGAQTTGQVYSYADKVFMRVTFCVVTGEKDADANAQESLTVERKGSSSTANDFLESPKAAADPKPSAPLPPHDKATGEVLDLPPYQATLAPSFKDGLPLIDTRKLEDEKAVKTIIEIFKVFLPGITTKAKATDWHALSVPAIEKAEKISPGSKEFIAGLFKARIAAIAAKTAKPKDEFEL